MDLQVPTDLIRKVQLSLRKEAGLSSYDPSDPDLPALRSLRESVAGFDPSPPYLRCKHCQGRLLRELQSVICAYCGRRQLKDVPPEPIAFKSTFGYQWLLQSLDLDGSETVGPSIEENELNRGQSSPKSEVSLSDLLNLEITWPAELEKTQHGLTSNESEQNKHSPYFTGVDLDNFFSEPMGDLDSNLSGEQPVTDKQSENVEMDARSRQENLSLFQDAQDSAIAVSSSEAKNNASFTGWEADFESADSGSHREASSSVDPFLGSSVDLSAHMDSVFGHDNNLRSENPEDASTLLVSSKIEQSQDDLWNSSNFLGSHQAEKDGASIKTKDGLAADNLYNHSAMSNDWFPDDQWQTSSKPAPDAKTVCKDEDEDEDSFDAWNDFTSSTSAHDPSKSPLTQSDCEVTTIDGQTSDITFSNSTSNFPGMDFGSFTQPDLSSGSFDNKNCSPNLNNVHPEVPPVDRMGEVNVGGNVGQAAKDGDIFSSATQSEYDVENLLSQMHDLSFMLKSDLSVPSKVRCSK